MAYVSRQAERPHHDKPAETTALMDPPRSSSAWRAAAMSPTVCNVSLYRGGHEPTSDGGFWSECSDRGDPFLPAVLRFGVFTCRSSARAASAPRTS